MKHILGLDLGSNSIGWALIEQDFDNKQGKIIGLGSRIIPIEQKILSKFKEGTTVSQTAKRTEFRGIRRLRERHLLRRERLHRVLHLLGFLPAHYDAQIDFTKRFGKFIGDSEPKLAYNNEGFIFLESFNEMVEDFKKHQPQLFYIKSNGEESKIPYDWTIYYLRKKALYEKISKEELAWIILNFNQKRGYYQLREEEEEKENDFEIISSKVLSVVKKEKDKKDKKYNKYWYDIILENGLVYTAAFYNDFVYSWVDQEREFVAKRTLLKNGSEKVELSYLPTFDEIAKMNKQQQDKFYQKIKIKTENSIGNKPVGAYIYDHLLQNPNQKIKGKLVRTIERKFYKEELKAILEKQVALQPELFTEELFVDCVRELYKNNEIHQNSLSSKDFVHLFLNDIIFYQRPLRSQKSNISSCSLEYRFCIDKETKQRRKTYLKVISKSNPYYQEFRVLQWLSNLKIYRKEDDKDVTSEFISSIEDKETLYEFLMSEKEVSNKSVLEFLLMKSLRETYPFAKETELKKELKKEITKYRWNYVYEEGNDSKKYPMNETGYEIKKRLKEVKNIPDNFLTKDIEYQLWHIIYSVTDKYEYEKALMKFAQKHNLDAESFVEHFKKIKPYPSDYGAFSEKAIKKLLPLMRFGKYWNYSDISEPVQARISDIINGVDNESIKTIVREKAEKFQLSQEADFQGLPLWMAQYVVYGIHSEAADIQRWTSPSDLEEYLKGFKQHSLRNPIVEQVVTETLRVVKDIWEYYGKGEENFFDEIHIELGRELKKTAEERNRMTREINENEETNLKVKKELQQIFENKSAENVRPYSPIQQEKYRLWLEQKKSPYTGQTIPLSKLFTDEYQIEHVIPQSRFFDDSLSNKVICESAVNAEKGALLGLEFIKEHRGKIVDIGLNKKVRILNEKEYKELVNELFANNRGKKAKLLMEEIPEKMVERQLNDTRYISKFISQILSNIVRSPQEDNGVNSKNIIPCTGKITAALKQDWGLNDVWNDLILPRFERMNNLTQTELFTTYSEKYQKKIPTVPLEHAKGFQKKRIDHRHHAMDALVVACATRSHINYMNNQHALDKHKAKEEKQNARIDLRTVLCEKKYNDNAEDKYNWTFKKPWNTFTQDVRSALEMVVVSFKQNLRVINKATNYYEKWVEEKGKKVKKKVKQEGINWAIRKPLHEQTVSGKITLERVKVGKGKILTATRKSIDSSFTEKTIASITDTGIQKILLNYLAYKGSSELAFSPEGLEELNKNIYLYNDGKPHKPIYKVRSYEKGSGRFVLGERGAKSKKYVQGAPNLYFGVYQSKGKRSYATIPLAEVIERQKQGLISVPELNEKGEKLLFSLSPNDLVYVPMEGEDTESIDFTNLSKEQRERVYNVNDFSSTCYFTPNRIAKAICPKEVDMQRKGDELSGSYDTKTASMRSIQIKEFCIKLKIDRLGNIFKA
jgi:CRISPR-associated protein, csn1 family